MSIKQNPGRTGRRHDGPLPDFRNLGVVLRVLVGVNGLGLIAVLARSGQWSSLGGALMDMAMCVEPPLIVAVAALFLLQPVLARMPAPAGWVGVGAVALAAAALFNTLLAPLDVGDLASWLGWTALLVVAVRAYFRYLAAVYAPSLAEARLLALTARIRPHFLFNSLNGVLGILRSDPRRAEAALEELADLFRALMRENRDLVPLADEVALCERYLALEHLRLGPRLSVRWDCAPDVGTAQVPPLFLQPLVENAVYHGIEPGAGPGEVAIAIRRHGPELRIEIVNPLQGGHSHPGGNRMAVDNIRERLMLFFDLEAGLETEQADGLHRVRIRLPYRTAT